MKISQIAHNLDMYNLLLATRDKNIKGLFSRAFDDYEINIVCVEDSSLALLYSIDLNFNYAILDNTLRGLCGDKLTSLIQKIRPKISIIFLFGKNEKDLLSSSNIKLSIRKPLNSSKLKRIQTLVIPDYKLNMKSYGNKSYEQIFIH